MGVVGEGGKEAGWLAVGAGVDGRLAWRRGDGFEESCWWAVVVQVGAGGWLAGDGMTWEQGRDRGVERERGVRLPRSWRDAVTNVLVVASGVKASLRRDRGFRPGWGGGTIEWRGWTRDRRASDLGLTEMDKEGRGGRSRSDGR